MPPTRSQRELRRLEDAVVAQDLRQQTEPRTLPCGHEAPATPPGRLPKAITECEACKREAEGNRPLEQIEKITVDIGELGATATATGWALAERIFEQRPELLGPSAQEEAAALEAIDRARDEEQAANEPRPFGPRARFTGTQRIEDGRLIQVWHHPVTGLQKVVV